MHGFAAPRQLLCHIEQLSGVGACENYMAQGYTCEARFCPTCSFAHVRPDVWNCLGSEMSTCLVNPSIRIAARRSTEVERLDHRRVPGVHERVVRPPLRSRAHEGFAQRRSIVASRSI